MHEGYKAPDLSERDPEESAIQAEIQPAQNPTKRSGSLAGKAMSMLTAASLMFSGEKATAQEDMRPEGKDSKPDEARIISNFETRADAIFERGQNLMSGIEKSSMEHSGELVADLDGEFAKKVFEVVGTSNQDFMKELQALIKNGESVSEETLSRAKSCLEATERNVLEIYYLSTNSLDPVKDRDERNYMHEVVKKALINNVELLNAEKEFAQDFLGIESAVLTPEELEQIKNPLTENDGRPSVTEEQENIQRMLKKAEERLRLDEEEKILKETIKKAEDALNK